MSNVLTFFGAVLLVLAMFVVIATPVVLLARLDCNRLETNTGIETRYDLINGCLIKVNDRFVPQDNWRGEYQQ